jgi:hypothetical protein
MSNTNDKIKPQDFSSYLFWDVDQDRLDMENSKKLIIERVLEYGQMKDWNLLRNYYGLEEIKNTAQTIKSFDKVTLSFLCNLFDMEKTQFRCYTHKQSTPNYWEY